MTVTNHKVGAAVLDEHATPDRAGGESGGSPPDAPVVTYPTITTEAPKIVPPNPLVNAAISIGWGLSGFVVLGLLWQFGHMRSPDLPGPLDTLSTLRELLGTAFASDTSAGQGIGLQVRDSLDKVFRGFAFATIVGVPLGFLLGTSTVAWKMFNPIVQLLRPVSPLAWFPVCLALLTLNGPAAVATIFITSMMPTIVNTAFGASSVPRDQHDVARVFRFSKFSELREVVVPHSLPYVITGLRLSMGIAWLVIVAAEMLSAASGIGFFVWQSYNGQGIRYVLSAIIIIGAIGLLFDQVFVAIGKRLSGEGTT